MKFKLKRTVDEFDAEVIFDSMEDLSIALVNLRKIIQAAKISEAQNDARSFLIDTEGTRHIGDSVSDSGHRVALSLLNRWPTPVRNTDIVSDTGISKAGVYDNLTGRRGDKGDWFSIENEMYVLSAKGEEEIIKFVIGQLDGGN